MAIIYALEDDHFEVFDLRHFRDNFDSDCSEK